MEEDFYITEKEKMECVRLLQGIIPSELGLDFLEAADMLSRYEMMLDDQLKFMEANKESNSGKKLTLTRVLRKAHELSQMFREAARLTGTDTL